MDKQVLTETCKHCGGEAGKHEAPVEHSITLFGYEFVLRYWHEVYLDECFECIADIHDEPYRQAYHAGCHDGYNEALQELRY